MKKIEAIIRPFKIEEVREALAELGIDGLTITEVTGFGHQKSQTDLYRGGEFTVEFNPKAKLDIIVPDEKVEAAVKAILQAARTGRMGDGKIFVSTVDEVVRIRTAERGGAAI